jgi:8-oxo-dGTP pyrophosphatase MutT (NUDIX family)
MPPVSTRIARLVDRLASAPPPARAAPESVLFWAAVAVVLVPDPEALLLIRRAERLGDPWSGHMALPGGRRAATDESLLQTAMRETAEEVGLALAADHCVGVLDDVAPRTPVLPPIAVRPYVFSLPDRPALTPNPEVAAVQWVTLDELLHPATYRSVHIEIQGGRRLVEAFQLEHAVVWGMTERILSNLLPLFS